MAGSASNWFKPTMGPLKGVAIYLTRLDQQDLAARLKKRRRTATGTTRDLAAAAIELGDKPALVAANRTRPHGVAKASRRSGGWEGVLGGADQVVNAPRFGVDPDPDTAYGRIFAAEDRRLVLDERTRDAARLWSGSVSAPENFPLIARASSDRASSGDRLARLVDINPRHIP